MRRELPRMAIISAISLIVYNAIPVLALLFPDSVAYYSFLLDLWILVPLYVFFLGIIVCAFNQYCVYLPILAGVLYLPTMLIFYNTSVFPYVIVYILLNFAGCFIGLIIYRYRTKQIY